MPFVFEDDADYKNLPDPEKVRFRQMFYDKVVSADPDFKSLIPSEQDRLRDALVGPIEPSGPSPIETALSPFKMAYEAARSYGAPIEKTARETSKAMFGMKIPGMAGLKKGFEALETGIAEKPPEIAARLGAPGWLQTGLIEPVSAGIGTLAHLAPPIIAGLAGTAVGGPMGGLAAGTIAAAPQTVGEAALMGATGLALGGAGKLGKPSKLPGIPGMSPADLELAALEKPGELAIEPSGLSPQEIEGIAFRKLATGEKSGLEKPGELAIEPWRMRPGPEPIEGLAVSKPPPPAPPVLSPQEIEGMAFRKLATGAGLPAEPSMPPVLSPQEIEGMAFRKLTTKAEIPAESPMPQGAMPEPVAKMLQAKFPGVAKEMGLKPSLTSLEGRTLLLRESVDKASKKVSDAVNEIEGINTRAKTVLEESGIIEKTGTLAKETRPEFRKGGVIGVTEADIRGHKISHQAIQKTQAELINAAEELGKLKSQISQLGDPESIMKVDFLHRNYETAIKKLNNYAEQFNLDRFAVNRAMKAYDTPVPREIIDTIKEAGVLVNGLKQVKARLPITENIITTLRQIANERGTSGLPSGLLAQLGRDAIEQIRLNLFSPFSFSLDFLTNSAELATKGISSLSHDIVYAATRKISMPATKGMIEAIRTGTKHLPAEIENAFDLTVSGEKLTAGIRGKIGTFYTRRGPISTFYDYMIGLPLYAKSAIDTGAKRIASMGHLYREAYIAADKAALVGKARDEFIDKFITSDAPKEAMQNAITAGKKAGFSRDLSKLEETIAGNPAVKLLAEAFPRWGFQFTRWAGEMLGGNPELLKKLASGQADASQVAEYLTRTATGWGGLHLLNNLYDRIDFRSMEYVKPNGNRVRLSSREPLSTGLFLLAILHGDMDNALASLKFASIPGSQLLSGEGGLLTSVIRQLQRASESKEINPSKISNELANTINRAIPGQALLGLIKTMLDPTVRQGIGAGLPIISEMKKPVIDPTTGKPLKPQQRIPGTTLMVPSVLGTPIPGAERVMNPVQQVLSKYGRMIYRGLGTSIAGIPANKVPDEYRDEWLKYLGEERQRIVGPYAAKPEFLDKMGRDAAKKLIAALDSDAAKIATTKLIQAHPDLRKGAFERKVHPKEAARERGMPRIFR